MKASSTAVPGCDMGVALNESFIVMGSTGAGIIGKLDKHGPVRKESFIGLSDSQECQQRRYIHRWYSELSARCRVNLH